MEFEKVTNFRYKGKWKIRKRRNLKSRTWGNNKELKYEKRDEEDEEREKSKLGKINQRITHCWIIS